MSHAWLRVDHGDFGKGGSNEKYAANLLCDIACSELPYPDTFYFNNTGIFGPSTALAGVGAAVGAQGSEEAGRGGSSMVAPGDLPPAAAGAKTPSIPPAAVGAKTPPVKPQPPISDLHPALGKEQISDIAARGKAPAAVGATLPPGDNMVHPLHPLLRHQEDLAPPPARAPGESAAAGGYTAPEIPAKYPPPARPLPPQPSGAHAAVGAPEIPAKYPPPAQPLPPQPSRAYAAVTVPDLSATFPPPPSAAKAAVGASAPVDHVPRWGPAPRFESQWGHVSIERMAEICNCAKWYTRAFSVDNVQRDWHNEEGGQVNWIQYNGDLAHRARLRAMDSWDDGSDFNPWASRWRFDEDMPDIAQPWNPLMWRELDKLRAAGGTFRPWTPQALFIKHLCKRYQGEVAFASDKWTFDQRPLENFRAKILWNKQFATDQRTFDNLKQATGDSAVGEVGKRDLLAVGSTTILRGAVGTRGHWRRSGTVITLPELIENLQATFTATEIMFWYHQAPKVCRKKPHSRG